MKTTKKAVKKIVKKPVDKPQFTATAIVLGKKYTAKGGSVLEAVSKLEVRNCKGKCILVVEQGDYRKERILQPMQAYRLFNSMGMTREVALKNVSVLF